MVLFSSGSIDNTYVEEFLNDPDNQDLLGHHASDVKYAKLEGREEGRAEGRAEGRTEANKYTAINLLKAGIDKITVAKCIGLDVSDLDKLLSKQITNTTF